jgi:predicted secreted hydrolase
MSCRSIGVLVVFIVLCGGFETFGACAAQGDSRFHKVEGPCGLDFPEDHGPHPDYRSEWWYYTGNLRSAAGRPFGYQLTIFRYQTGPSGDREQWPQPASAWRAQQIFIAHAAVTDVQTGNHRQAQAAARGALGMAGAEYVKKGTSIFVGKYSIDISGLNHLLRAVAPDFGFDLRLAPQKQLVLHGDQGYSRKGSTPSKASCYYSYTRLSTQGNVTINGQSIPVNGLSWMDHEFSTAPLDAELVGWDWFSLQLSNRSELMLYFLRHADGRHDPASSGTFVDAAGKQTFLAKTAITIETLQTWRSPHSQGRYPCAWQVKIPKLNLELHIQTQVADQEMRTRATTGVVYWEGNVKASGILSEQAVSGQGYVELTGYAEPFKAPL